MEIAKWMKHPVLTAKPRDTIAHAREVMEQHRVNQLPVVVDGRVVGIITDRDLRDAYPSVFESAGAGRRRPAPGTDPTSISVQEVMSQNVITLGPHDDVAAATRLMRQERIGAVPIIERERLVGILTRSDVLDAFVALAES